MKTDRLVNAARLATVTVGERLSRRRGLILVALIGLVLTLPALGAGWILDDHHLRLRLQQPPALPVVAGPPLLTLFSFADGVPEHNRQLMDIGFWPWWTVPTIRASFFRPITAMSHWLDHALWPRSAALMHLQSLMWYAGVIFATALLYRRILGTTCVAGLAALLFAIDDAHCLPAAWLANRNAMIAALFGVLAIVAHDRWRRDRWRFGAALGPLLMLLSLLSKEEGLATWAYLLAYTLFLDEGSWRRRLAALTPYVLVIAAWRVVWSMLGYGVTAGFFIYVDPLQEPLRYLAAVAERIPVYLAAQCLLPPADLNIVLSWLNLAWLYWGGTLALVVFVAVMFKRHVPWTPAMRFFAAGMLMSLAPLCAAIPGDRLLLFVGLGALPIIAQYLTVAFGKTTAAAPGEVARSVGRWGTRLAVLLIVVHVILAPLVLIVHSAMPFGPRRWSESMYVSLPDDLDLSGKTVCVVNASVPIVAGYLPERRALDGLSVPARTRVLGPSIWERVSVSRPDAHTLVLDVPGGLTQFPFSQLARSRRYPMHAGDRVELAGMTADVRVVTEDGLPANVAFSFDVPLEDPSLVWVHCTDEGLERFAPPPIGGTIDLGPYRALPR